VVGDDDLRALAGALRTRSFGRVHEHHGELTSTNDRALQWLREGAEHGALVTADAQTAGRGRMGRTWSSPAAGDLYVSVIARPFDESSPPSSIGALGLAVGAGLREGLLEAVPELSIDLKWPNDLLVDGRKLAGILCETRWQGDRPEIVIGFGLNVGRRELDPAIVDVATSLALLVDRPPRRVELLAALLRGLEEALDPFFDGGFVAIRDRYEPHCVVLGKAITLPVTRADGSTERIHATAVELAADGALVVRSRAGGEPFRVENADVWLAPDE
jgi:BirA family biotin operon repressor/biotin-[acetyl-CoA-carboxylase] ligase